MAAEPGDWAVGDRVRVTKDHRGFRGRVGSVHRLGGPVFEDHVYVHLDPRPRERVKKVEFFAVSNLESE